MRKRGIFKSIIATGLAMVMCLSGGVSAGAASGKWNSDATGWWYSYSDGSYAKDKWENIDGYWYYFMSDGYMDSDGYREGCWLGADGAWNTAYSGGHWASDSTGWWYTDASGWYPVSTWLRIDGKYYYFKSSGYMASNEWIEGSYVGPDGAWIKEYTTVVRKDMCDGTPDNVKYTFSAEKAYGWQNAYYNKIKDAKAIGGGAWNSKSPAYCYYVYDIDNNGVPELFIKYGTCEADYSIEIYTYEDSLKLIKKSGAAHQAYYSIPGTGMLVWWAHMGDSSISKLTLSGGELKSESVSSETTTGEYKKPSDFYAGATSFDGCQMDNPLAIVGYGIEFPETGSSDKNAEAKAKIKEVMEKNGKVYLSFTNYFDDRENKGIMNFNDLKKKGNLNKYYSLTKNHESWGDLNKDGQEECLIVFDSTKKKTSGSSVVLSYQNGQVYAYYVFYAKDSMEIKNGRIVIPDSYGTSEESLCFYKDLAYTVYYD